MLNALEKSLVYNEEDAHLLYRAAAAFFQHKQFENGLQHLEKALKKNYQLLYLLYEYFPEADQYPVIENLVLKYSLKNL